jgi:integrase
VPSFNIILLKHGKISTGKQGGEMEPQKSNRPQKGDVIKVQPITDKKSIQTIKKLLAGKPRDLALFVIGINTNLRASDLVQLTAGQVRHCTSPGCEIEITEKKTGKVRRITLNKAAVEAVQNLLKANCLSNNDPLFKSQRGQALTVSSIHRLVKSWCRDIGLKGNYGSHTLRKTFGYHARQAGVSLPILVELFNHASQKQTMTYLGIQPEEIKDAYLALDI